MNDLRRAGVPEQTAMKLTGHKTREVFNRYDIQNEDDLRVAVGRLAGVEAIHSRVQELEQQLADRDAEIARLRAQLTEEQSKSGQSQGVERLRSQS